MDFHSKSLGILDFLPPLDLDRQGERRSKSGPRPSFVYYLWLNCGETMFSVCSYYGTCRQKTEERQVLSRALAMGPNARAGARDMRCRPSASKTPPQGAPLGAACHIFPSRINRLASKGELARRASRGPRGKIARRPVSRVLSLPRDRGWPFIWDARCRAPRATDPDGGVKTRLPAVSSEEAAGGRPYLVLLPVGFALPPPSPEARGALTAPFRPCRHP